MSDSGPSARAAVAPQDDLQKSAAADLRPPKQRYKEHAQSESAASPPDERKPALHSEKRPLSAVLAEAEDEIVASAAGGAGSPSTVPPGSDHLLGRPQPRQIKQPRQQDSLIRNIARPHKPRIGPEYQAQLPPLSNPNHAPAQP